MVGEDYVVCVDWRTLGCGCSIGFFGAEVEILMTVLGNEKSGYVDLDSD